MTNPILQKEYLFVQIENITAISKFDKCPICQIKNQAKIQIK